MSSAQAYDPDPRVVEPAGTGEGPDWADWSCAFIAFDPIPTDGAYCIHDLEMCDAMTSVGVDTELVAYSALDPPAEPAALRRAFGLRHLPRVAWVARGANKLSRMYIRATRSFAAGRRATFVYSTRPMPAAFALLAGARHAFFQAELLDLRLPDRIALALVRRSPRFRVVSISARLADLLADRYGIDRGSVIVEHCGHAFPIRYDHLASRTPERPLRAMYVGSFLPGRGLEMIVELARRHPSVEFLLVGGERDLAGVPANVHVRGRVPHAEVAGLLVDADVLLMPYTRDVRVFGGSGGTAEYCSPLKMFEYLAAGRPIIASDLPSIGEVLVDGSNALLAEPDSVADWSQALTRLTRDPGLRARLARSAAETAEHYVMERRVQRILDRVSSRPAEAGRA